MDVSEKDRWNHGNYGPEAWILV